MSQSHIASAFDRDLEAIQATIMKMGGLVEAAIRDSAKSLEMRDEELASRVRAADKQIDALEEQVNDEAARVIAIRAPIASDMRTVLSVIKISANLERVGDYSKNLAKRTGVLLQLPQVDGAPQSIRRMAREVEQMLHDVLDAYIQRDAELALEVRNRDADVDQMYNALFREFLTFMMEDPRNITACMHLHFIAKNIERMGDHVTSIADQVIYTVTGEMPDDARPKGDTTSLDAPEIWAMKARPLVMIVEDEASQREILAYNLRADGFDVTEARSGDEAMVLLDETAPDLVVLDWMLPGLSGIECCRQMKRRGDTRQIPVIMLSARTEEPDRVRGLETGADDYVVKPYSVAELMARIRANLRRTRPATQGERLEFEDIVLDAETHRVTRDGAAINLGPTEFRLLATLMEKPGRVWSREQLLDRVWGRDIYVDTRTVDVHVGRLRKALRVTGASDPLRTVRGTGYALG